MKKSLLVLLTVVWSIYCLAQDEDYAVAQVHYLFKHVNDTTQRDKFLRDDVVTYLGQHGSYYTTYSDRKMQDEMIRMLNDPAFDGNINITKSTSTISEFYLLKPAEEIFEEIRKITRDIYVLNAEMPEQDWVIEEDTREIGGYSCQRATTSFKGRNYTAWFTTELPFPYGPWKLHGLPGLILEAYDDTKEVVFEYAGFDKEITGRPVLIGVPETAHRVSMEVFQKQADAFKANPQAYMDARMGARSNASVSEVVSTGSAGGRATIRVSGSSGGGASPAFDPSKIKSMSIKDDDNYKPSRETNNPIELTP